MINQRTNLQKIFSEELKHWFWNRKWMKSVRMIMTVMSLMSMKLNFSLRNMITVSLFNNHKMTIILNRYKIIWITKTNKLSLQIWRIVSITKRYNFLQMKKRMIMMIIIFVIKMLPTLNNFQIIRRKKKINREE